VGLHGTEYLKDCSKRMMAAMKQRRPSRRKPSKKRSPRPPAPRPQPGPEILAWQQPLTTPQQPKVNLAALMASSGIVEPILPPSETPDKPSFKGEVDKAAQHAEMLSRIAILESLIAELPKQPVGIGHNQPLMTKDDIQEIKQAIATLKAQPVMPTAPDQAKAAGSTLIKFGERLGTYLLKQADLFVSEAVKEAAKLLMKLLALSNALMLVGNAVEAWLK
jgi:hypothetical protein